jgi:hypothetical protein
VVGETMPLCCRLRHETKHARRLWMHASARRQCKRDVTDSLRRQLAKVLPVRIQLPCVHCFAAVAASSRRVRRHNAHIQRRRTTWEGSLSEYIRRAERRMRGDQVCRLNVSRGVGEVRQSEDLISNCIVAGGASTQRTARSVGTFSIEHGIPAVAA